MLQDNQLPRESIIHLPKLVTEAWSITLMERFGNVLESDELIVLNAENVVWMSPFGTIILAKFAYERLNAGKRVQIRMPKNGDTKEYIRNSGLLKLTTSTNIQNAIDKENVQLRLLSSMEPMVPETITDFITSQAGKVGDDEKYLLRMWITELLTNANDHSDSKEGFWVCGRYNPYRRDIRICVADSGIGIRKSLVDSGKLPASIDDAQSIEKAIEAGMTSRPGKTGGLGLKHISSYVKSHDGSMTICSGTGKLYVARGTKRIKHQHKKYQGTLVNVMFNIGTISEDENVSQNAPFVFE